MANLISYLQKDVPAKGAKPDNRINQEKLKAYFFDNEYDCLKLLQNIPKIDLPTAKPLLFYPGCGVDILFPLFYVEALFQTKQVSFLFVDKDNTLGMIKTILDDIGIHFSERKNILRFYWDGILVDLEFVTGNVFELLKKIPSFDIYFERAFRIMREQHLNYEQQIFTKLNKNGVLISDSGYQQCNLKVFPLPQELSSYREMIAGQKE